MSEQILLDAYAFLDKSNVITGLVFFVLEGVFLVLLVPTLITAQTRRRTRRVWRKMAASLVKRLEGTINTAIDFEATVATALEGGDDLYLTPEQFKSVESARNEMIREIRKTNTVLARLNMSLLAFEGVARAFSDAMPIFDDLDAATARLMTNDKRNSYGKIFKEKVEPLIVQLEAIKPEDGFSIVLKPSRRTEQRSGIKRLVAWAREWA